MIRPSSNGGITRDRHVLHHYLTHAAAQTFRVCFGATWATVRTAHLVNVQDEALTAHPQFTSEKPQGCATWQPLTHLLTVRLANITESAFSALVVFFIAPFPSRRRSSKWMGTDAQNETPVEWIPQWHGLDKLLV